MNGFFGMDITIDIAWILSTRVFDRDWNFRSKRFALKFSLSSDFMSKCLVLRTRDFVGVLIFLNFLLVYRNI